MPWVLVGFGDMVWAMVAVALVVGGILVAKGFENTIGKLPWPIGWAIKDAISFVTGGISRYIWNLTNFAWPRVGAFIRSHPYLMGSFLGAIARTFEHHGNQIAHLNNNVIPSSHDDALSRANNYTTSVNNALQGRIDGVQATESNDVRVLHADLSSLRGYVDGPFRNAVNNEVNAARTEAENQAAADLNNAISIVVSRIANDEQQLANLMDIATVQIPSEIQQAQQAAESQAHNELVAVVDQLVARLNDLQSQIIANANAEQEALAAAKAAIATQQAQDLTTAEGFAVAQAASSLAASQMALAAQAAQQTAALQSQASAVSLQLQGIRDKQTIDEANIGAVTNVATVAIPLSIAAVSTSVATLAQEVTRCMVTTCEGPNNWQNLLQQALGVASFAEVAAFIGQAIKDPKGESAALASVAGTTYNAGHSLIDSLLSL